MRGSVVTAAAADAQAFVVLRQDLNRVITAVGAELGGFVGERVLAAQFVLNFDEGVGHIVQLKGEEGASAGGVGDAFENFVAASALLR